MSQKILYTDKETFQVSPLDEENKATAANYNEIKDVVNNNADELDAIVSGAIQTTGVIAISSAELLAINTTPKEIIPAQGADTVIILTGFFITYFGGATGYATDTSIKLFFNNGARAVLSPISIAGTNDTFSRGDRLSDVFGTTTDDFTNQNLVLSTDSSDPTLGDGTMEVVINYIVMSV